MLSLFYQRPKPPADTIVPEPVDTSFLSLEFPHLVTQNEDEYNEVFEIKNQQSGDLVEMEWYNRWGKKVAGYDRYQRQFQPADQSPGLYFWRCRISYNRNQKLRQVEKNGWL